MLHVTCILPRPLGARSFCLQLGHLKIAYIFVAIFLTLSSFALIGFSFFAFLGTLIGGNLIARVVFEAALMRVMIWKNTTEIKNKLK